MTICRQIICRLFGGFKKNILLTMQYKTDQTWLANTGLQRRRWVSLNGATWLVSLPFELAEVASLRLATQSYVFCVREYFGELLYGHRCRIKIFNNQHLPGHWLCKNIRMQSRNVKHKIRISLSISKSHTPISLILPPNIRVAQKCKNRLQHLWNNFSGNKS